MIDPARLLSLLPFGHDKAKPATLLAYQLGTTTRQVGLAVAELRKAGVLVGSACGMAPGYFLCTTEEDVAKGLAHIVARVSESMKAVRAMRKAAAERFQPETLSLFDLEAS